MKQASLVLLGLIFASASAVYADGLPIEHGKVTMPHTLLDLSESQVEELEALGSVTLSKTQWAQIRKVSPATAKRVAPILPETLNDCGCHLGYNGGILMKNGQLALIHHSRSPESFAVLFDAKKQLTFRVDSRGQFYLDGSLIRFKMLLETINASTPFDPSEKGHLILLSVPPLMAPNHQVFNDRLVQIKGALEAKGWKVEYRQGDG